MSLKNYLNRFLIFFILSSSAWANEILHDFKILEVIDGDTIRIEANFLPQPLKPSLLLRINGVDAPEKGSRAKCAEERVMSKNALNYVKDLFQKGIQQKVLITKWDKFGGRVLGDVLIGDRYLSELLISNGFAKKYNGGKKESWCDD